MEGSMSGTATDEEGSAQTETRNASPPHMEPPATENLPDVTEKTSRSKLFNRSSSYLLTEPLWMKAIRLSMIGMLSIIEVAIGMTYIVLLSALEVVLLGVYACIFLKRLVCYKLLGSARTEGTDQRNGPRPEQHLN
ncbi:hypothetical protein RvY_17348-2 [Ramazzottius varieornatus]|uniref:Uncharacterized protein n=1 Tax=Ramazzottius varieornatus TaxID=947166 RepID=A0A1D1W1U3_RAMVA|nr:hypothetical protein RvY_17348-2 [Ramazzottius varieornatus]